VTTSDDRTGSAIGVMDGTSRTWLGAAGPCGEATCPVQRGREDPDTESLWISASRETSVVVPEISYS
jgi:hypothetical protein